MTSSRRAVTSRGHLSGHAIARCQATATSRCEMAPPPNTSPRPPCARTRNVTRRPRPTAKRPQPLVDLLANQLAGHVPAAMRACFQTVSGGGFAVQPTAAGRGECVPPSRLPARRGDATAAGWRPWLSVRAAGAGFGCHAEERRTRLCRAGGRRAAAAPGGSGESRLLGTALCLLLLLLLPGRGRGAAGQGGPGGRCVPGRAVDNGSNRPRQLPAPRRGPEGAEAAAGGLDPRALRRRALLGPPPGLPPGSP